MTKKLKVFISGEFFFALYLFAGVFKESLAFPVDIAAVFLALTGVSIIVRFMLRPTINKHTVLPFVIFILIFSIILLSYIYTPSEVYAKEKLVKFIVLTIPTTVFPFFLFTSKESVVRFLKSLCALSVVLSIIILPTIYQRGSDLAFVGFNNGTSSQGLARLNGVSLIILIFYSLLEAKDKRKKAGVFFLILLVAFVLLATGSRMPLLALFCAGIYAIFRSVKIRKGILVMRKGFKMLLSASVLGLFLLAALATRGFFDTIIYRFKIIFSESGGGASANGRIERFSVAWDVFKEHFVFGGGLGSFPIFYNETDIGDYPHNIVLEIMAEFGLIGLSIFSLFFFLTFYRGLVKGKRSGRQPSVQLAVICLFVYYLANAMVSGDINSNRALYVFMSILCLLPFLPNKHENKSAKTNEMIEEELTKETG